MIQKREQEKAKQNLEQFFTEKNLIVTPNPMSALDTVQLLTTDDICRLMRVDRHVVYDLANSGELPGFKKKGWKFRLQDFQRYLANQVEKE
ncbi:MAG: helix-turn-helix domain-containing protein [Cyclobacteriaceae bacterium]|nr:helix-turn-helix domain-containing protein [Cyclobacteriaceae bacterium]